MPVTKDLGRVYLTSMRYLHRKAAPLIAETGWTAEIEEPYRRGRCLVVRIPFTLRAIVLGLWGQPGTEAQRLADIGYRELGPLDLVTELAN